MNCHAAENADGMMHTMAGLPPGVLYGTIAAAAVITLWSLVRGHAWFNSDFFGRWRLDVTALRPVGWLIKRRPFQFMLQLPLVGMLLLIIAAGFMGTPVADRNAATVLTWTIWWTLLILDIVLLGRMWCLVCPWDAIASWFRRLAFWRRRTDEPLALNLKWPRWLKNVYLATFLFIGLTWLELGWGVTMSPRATATLALLMVLLAVVPAMIFERRAFCQYGCLIGRICGLYSMIAPVEVRARDEGVCRDCSSKDCLTGNENGYPCPTGQCIGTMKVNTYCTVCTECVKTCPHDNVAVNLRPWCTDLHSVRKPKRDEAVLALVMLSLTSFHGLTMTPTWNRLLDGVRDSTGLEFLPAFSIGMLVILLVPSAIYLTVTAAATRLGAGSGGSFWRVTATYAYPLVAVALMYHLAHNAGHFLGEARVVLRVISDPFGSGADLIGTASMAVTPLASMPTVWSMMVGLVLVGHLWAVRAVERAHRNLADAQLRPRLPLGARLCTSGFLLLATCANLWLLAQPMEMRTGM